MSQQETGTEEDKSNPKTHDNVFKWALATFSSAFFDYFAKEVNVSKIEVIDKEFIKKYEPLKESIKGDLFMAVAVEMEGEPWEIVILIELKSKREDVHRKMREYMCYASLLRDVPVWGIVVYTDEADWRLEMTDKFPFAYTKESGLHRVPYDIIKLKHKSAELIKQRSLLLKVLALKADDTGCDREELIREIYRAVAEQEAELTDDQKLLVERFVITYAKLPDSMVDKIKKEVKMTFVASTITEHIRHEGELIERARSAEQIKRSAEQIKREVAGRKRAEAEAKRAKAEAKRTEAEAKRSILTNLEEMFEEGLITAKTFETKAAPLRKALIDSAYKRTKG